MYDLISQYTRITEPALDWFSLVVCTFFFSMAQAFLGWDKIGTATKSEQIGQRFSCLIVEILFKLPAV